MKRFMHGSTIRWFPGSYLGRLSRRCNWEWVKLGGVLGNLWNGNNLPDQELLVPDTFGCAGRGDEIDE